MATFEPYILLSVRSSALNNRWYTINRFTEYNVDIDLETDSDGFDFTFKNQDGIYSGLVSRFDNVKISYNSIPIMYGIVDTVDYTYTADDSYIRVSGRDKMCILIDNDALPATKNNVKPTKYITDKCSDYGIKYNALKSASTIKELVIGCGESECSIMNNILLESEQRMWYIYDTLYSGEWSTNIKYKYIFTCGVSASHQGIPIISIKVREDCKDTNSEVRIYGSQDDDGHNKMVGKAINSMMVAAGIKRRLVKRSYKEDSSTKYSASALRDVRDSFRDNIEVEISVHHKDYVFMPNTVCKIIHKKLGINGTFFIKSVSYNRSESSGSIATLITIPSDSTFDYMWKSGTGVVSTSNSNNAMKLSVLLNKIGR